MPTNRNHRNDDLDDITGRRQIISPRDPQSGLPTGVRATEATKVTSAADMTYGDIEFDVVSPTLGDTATHEVGHVVGAGRGQDIEVENDESHFTERSAGPAGEFADGFESQTPPFADDPMANVIIENAHVTNIVQMENGYGDTVVGIEPDDISGDDW